MIFLSKRISFFLMMFPFIAFAQQSTNRQVIQQTPVDALKAAEQTIPSANFTTFEIDVTKDINQSILAHFQQSEPLLAQPDMGLMHVYTKYSRLGRHILYQQTYKGIPVLGATLKVNINPEGKILSVFNTLQTISATEFAPSSTANAHWLLVNQQPQLVYAYHEGENYIVKDGNGSVIRERDAKLYLMADDSTVSGKVFLPDPLTPIGVISGQDGTYKHFNDSDYALINDQRMSVVFPATYDSNVFLLKNKYVKLVDIQTPNISPPVSSTPSFDYLRGEDGFKDVMVIYHITNLQQQLHAIGINQVDMPIRCDAHAGTQDNSSFMPTDTTLRFGTGGVPDAEDADVIVHEFTHVLSFFITPSVSMSNERRAMEEGICDVQAAIYSHRYAGFNWRKLYNWDAPNPVASGTSPFWPGRNGASTKTYAQYSGSPYSDCEIWTSTILDIAEAIGHDSTLVLLFASLASYTDQTTMPQAAELFMQADSVLMNKAYGWKIGPIFNARGLGDFPTAIPEVQRLMKTLTMANTAEFAMGIGEASLELPFQATINVYDMQGRLVESRKANAGVTTFNPQQYVSGMYIVRIESQGSEAAIKLVR